jgi:hypothetical protein
MRQRRGGLFLALLIATTLRASVGAAQAEDQAGARVLFDEARQLMSVGRFDAACPKFEAARRLYAGSGILLNLGDCYERLGRTASAWTSFGEAVTTAGRLGRGDDEAEGKRRQSALEPKLSRISIHVLQEPPGLVVKRDGKTLDRAAWETPMPVDPGAHTISAEAPEREPWSSSVTVTDPGKTVIVEVPELPSTTSMSSKTSPVATASAAPSYWTPRRMVGAGLTGVGLVAMGAGGLLGLSAKSTYDTAAGETGAARHDDSVSASARGDLATVFVVVGAAISVGGVVLWVTAPSAPVAVGTNGRQILVGGDF